MSIAAMKTLMVNKRSSISTVFDPLNFDAAMGYAVLMAYSKFHKLLSSIYLVIDDICSH